MTPLEERIGYKFRNPLLLAEALTHPSVGHETQRHHFNNQRLEFLGDAILQLVITEYLFHHYKAEAEGQLTKLRSRLVSRETLRVRAAALELGQYLTIGRGEEASGGRKRASARWTAPGTITRHPTLGCCPDKWIPEPATRTGASVPRPKH